jgi:hypothetical protein
MLSAVLSVWWALAPGAPASSDKAPAGKLPTSVATEMQDAVLALNKVLGLESWPLRGVKPCVDRGGDGSSTKLVSAAEARTCAATALEHKFPGLGHDYVLTVLMASIGPATVLAFSTGAASGYGAYSCDPERKCRPLRLEPDSKWGKRLLERQARACSEPDTIWFPADARVCSGLTTPATPPVPAATGTAQKEATTPPPAKP